VPRGGGCVGGRNQRLYLKSGGVQIVLAGMSFMTSPIPSRNKLCAHKSS
jgi:hypothetical protein